MVKPMLRYLLAGSVCLLAMISAWAQDTNELNGKLDGQMYISPLGTYRIVLPILPELGGNVSDTENVVVFKDKFNVHISLGCFPQDATQRWEHSTRGSKNYLTYFFGALVFPDFQKSYPGARLESADFIPELMDGALLVHTLLPGGSMFPHRYRNITGDEPIPVAKRANLVFVRHGHVYVISMELAERAIEGSAYRRTAEEENALLRERLDTLLNGMYFNRPAAK